MRFLPTDEQLAFAEAVDDLVMDCGGVDVARSWAAGDHAAGRKLWSRLAEMGLGGIRVREEDGGLGGDVVDLVVVAERLGYHGAPGPYIESLALLPRLVDADTRAALAGGAVATAAVAGLAPYALDAQDADLVFTVDEVGIAPASPGAPMPSLSALRSLSAVVASGEAEAISREVRESAADEAALMTAAMLVGAGERLLDDAVSYALLREQFGRPIGEYQALKHQLADVRVALSFARPLVHAAALAFDADTRARDVSAAKIAAGDAATRAARTGLQVHGAIGYTAEHHTGIWVTAVPALVQSWGTPSFHRARVAAALLAG